MRATNTFIPCPICGKKFDTGLTEVMPFCSKRCSQVDLCRWMDEGYSVPWVPSQEELDAMDAAEYSDGSAESQSDEY